jgi:hypothetical protein
MTDVTPTTTLTPSFYQTVGRCTSFDLDQNLFSTDFLEKEVVSLALFVHTEEIQIYR